MKTDHIFYKDLSKYVRLLWSLVQHRDLLLEFGCKAGDSGSLWLHELGYKNPEYSTECIQHEIKLTIQEMLVNQNSGIHQHFVNVWIENGSLRVKIQLQMYVGSTILDFGINVAPYEVKPKTDLTLNLLRYKD